MGAPFESRLRTAIGSLSIGLAAALVVSACALKAPPKADDLKQEYLPNLQVPPQWDESANAEPIADDWIAALGDPQLDALVAEAIAHNLDLRIAAARLEQAAAAVKISGGQLLPSVDALARTGGKLGGDNSGLGGWLVGASWELDLWGRVRYGQRAAEDQYASVEADAAAAAQSVAALVAKAWFLAIEARQQRDLATEMVTAALEMARVAAERERVGAGSALEVAQAQASVQTLKDAERKLALALLQAIRSLEILLGRYPAAEIQASSAFAALPPPPAAGVPSELLERRPDVVAAQRRVNAAFSRVGEAQAARLPKVSLTAGVSSFTSDVFVLEDESDPVAGGGANVFIPLFRGGALKAQTEARIADQKLASALWAQTGLRAFGEVEEALATEVALREREPILADAARYNDEALALESVRFRVGSRDLRAVLQQQMALYSARSALLRVQVEQRVNRVNLHLALGGGFGS